MLLVAWWWTMAAAFLPSPAQMAAVQNQVIDAQVRVAEATLSQGLMTLGWVDEDDAPIF